MRRILSRLTAVALVLLVAASARAQDQEYFVGKRVTLSSQDAGFPGAEFFIGTGEIKALHPDGSADVAIYPYSTTQWGWDSNPSTKFKGLLPEGQPIKTVTVSKDALARFNETRFTAWVWEKGEDGRPYAWPKARLVSDKGDSVTVFVYSKDGKSGQERTLTGDELTRFRALNAVTKPGPGEASKDIAQGTDQVLKDFNAKLEQKGGRLPNGEIFPPIPSVPDLVKAIRDVAEKYAPTITAEANKFVRADLQTKMLREIFLKVETLSPIKHPRAASDAWRAAGQEASAALSAAGETNWLQRQIAERVNACYGKSKVLWTLLNLAEVPELTGMGFRLMDTQIHGLLAGKADDGSLVIWEPSEGYDPVDWKVGQKAETIFRDGDAGRGGQFLSYMPAFTPMTGETAHPRDNAKALVDAAAARAPRGEGLTKVLDARMGDAHSEDRGEAER